MTSPSTLAKGKTGVWIAEGGKLFLYDKNTRLLKPMYADLQLPDSGPTMVEGSEGSLWIALKEGGVMRVDTCGSMSLHLPGIKVMKLIKSNDQNIWIGSQDQGVFCFHLKVRSYITMNIMIRVFTRFGTIWRERYVRIWKGIYG